MVRIGVMKLSEPVRQIVDDFPEVRYVVALRDRGWRFVGIGPDEVAQVLIGTRTWWGGWTDHFYLRSDTECWAARTDHANGLVWKQSGGLVEVASALLDLPAPDQPGAPTLLLARDPSLRSPGRWLPGL
jgi:hypothetical protein